MNGRARNRALLARQLLLERLPLRPLRAIERLVGLQAQTPRSPYTALWSRLRDFDPMSLSALLEGRRAVRIALMRSTIHLVSAADALRLRPLMQPAVMRELATPAMRRSLDGLDLDKLADEAARVLREQPLTPARLGTALAETWPECVPHDLAHAARSVLPLVQIPPRGLWDRSGATTLATAQHWLGRDLDSDPSWDAVALRYLAAFGPASTADVVAWSRITGLSAVLARLRPRLKVLHDEEGRELFDLPRAPRPPTSIPAPPRFLPDFDNLLLAHADRNHVFADEHRKSIQSTNGVLPGTLLVDGFVGAVWNLECDDKSALLVVRSLDTIRSADADAIRDEARALLYFLAPDAKRAEVIVG